MPIVWFDKAITMVNSSGILSQQASISQTNSLTPAYALGKYQTVNQVPNGPIKSTLALSYYPIVTREPNYAILNNIRELADDSLYSGTTVMIAGVTGYNCYLKSYEIQSTPNSLVIANVAYDSFVPLSGQIRVRTFTTTDDWGDLTTMSQSGDWEDLTVMTTSGDWGEVDDSPIIDVYDKIPHGWTSYISSSGNKLIAPTYSFSYKCNMNWEPVYIIGQKNPQEVHLMGGSEEMSFVRDSFTHIQFSGEEVTGTFITGDWKIELFNYQLVAWQTAGSGALIFDVSGAKIIQSRLAVEVGDMVKTETNIKRFF